MSHFPTICCVGVIIGGLAIAGCGGDDETGSTDPGGAGGTGGDGGAGGGLPALSCGALEAARPDGTCVPVGVPADGCGDGFESDADGGCLPVVPADPCPEGQLMVLGETSCVALAPCSGKWGDAPIGPNTQFVDAAYSGGGSDGTEQQPWLTITAALAAASPGAVVAVAAGDYHELVDVEQPVALWGACPGTVTVHGNGQVGVFVGPAGIATEIHDLAITGSAYGVVVTAAQVQLAGLWVHDTGLYGVFLDGDFAAGTEATVQHSLIVRTPGAGISAVSAALSLEDVQVLDSLPDVNGVSGRGIAVRAGDGPASLLLERAIVQRGRTAGVQLRGATAEIHSLLVEDTLGREVDGLNGTGLTVVADGNTTSYPGDATVESSVITGAHRTGIQIEDSSLELRHSVIRDVTADADTMTNGQGVNVLGWTATSSLSATRSLVEETTAAGIFLGGAGQANGGAGKAQATLTGMLVRDIFTKSSGEFGIGINAQGSFDGTEQSELAVTDSLIERVASCGIAALDTAATLSGSQIREVSPDGLGNFGDGIVVYRYAAGAPPLEATLQLLVIQSGERTGVTNFGATVTTDVVRLECNTIDLDAEPGVGDSPAVFNVLANTQCGCAGAAFPCKVLSSGLDPPLPL